MEKLMLSGDAGRLGRLTCGVALCGILVNGLYTRQAQAQVVNNLIPDNTLGVENSIVTPGLGNLNTVQGGAVRGGNLFHSFQQFSVGTNQTLRFENGTTIQNILVRVTGAGQSTIDGTLGANGAANLWLVNPNGITLGTNAKLAIGGAFWATTAPAIPLGSEGLFRAVNPGESQLLAIQPSALFDLRQLPTQGDIQFAGNWDVNGKAVGLVGRNVTLRNSEIDLNGGGLEVSAVGRLLLDNTRIVSRNTVNNPAAPIQLQGGDVELRRSTITIPTTDNLALQRNQPATLNIQAGNSILLNGSRINQPSSDRALQPASFNPARAKQRSNLSPIQMTWTAGRDLILQNSAIATRGGAFQANIPGDLRILGSQLYSDNFMAQDADPIRIEAQNILFDRFDLAGQPVAVGVDVGISSNSVIAGRAGDIVLTARNNFRFQTTEGINTPVFPPGIGSNTITNANAGNIILTAGNRYEMDVAGIGNQSRPDRSINPNQQITGNNGQIVITAKTIDLDRFGFNMDHFSRGGGGQIVLNASEDIVLGDGGIGTNAKGAAQGASITLNAGRRLVMKPKSGLSTLAEQQSQGGNITVNATELLMQGSISTSTAGRKNAGNIAINAQRIELNEQVFDQQLERGTISSYTGTANSTNAVTTGNSGRITIDTLNDAGQLLLRDGAGIANIVFKNSSGNAGPIVVRAGTIEIQGGSQIINVTNSGGDTEVIDVQAARGIQLSGRSANGQSPSGILSAIQAETQRPSSQGIQIRTPSLTVTDGAGIIASTTQSGDSGDVAILADRAVFAGQNQGNSSGVLTSVGVSALPAGDVISLNTDDSRFTFVTLNPLLVGVANANASGRSGDIKLTVGSLELNRGAKLVTAVFGQGQAGDIAIRANEQIRLSDEAAIRADSGSGRGGSIDIKIDRGALILRRGSEISAVSRQGRRDGNIQITAPFIVGRSDENSDIFAVSQTVLNTRRNSVGNNVNIDATAILGFAYRNQFTPQNDIIATGQVTLNLPDIDPVRGTNVLEVAPIDVAQAIDRRCNPDSPGQSSSFTARGYGLPASPNQTIGADMQLTRLAQLPETPLPKPEQSVGEKGQTSLPETPIEAQSSVRRSNGQIRLQATNNTPAQLGVNRCIVLP